MNLRDLEYFVAIAEHGHFGKASRAVNVSQPTLSMQFKKLEGVLGGALIERLPRKALLTPLGEEVLPLARQILHLAKDIEEKSNQEKAQARVKIGVIPTLSPYLLPRINRSLIKTLQGRKILLNEAQTADLVKLVKDGALDAAILSTPLEEKGIEEREIFSEPFYLAVNKTHRLSKKKSVRIDDIKDEKLLLLDEGHCLRRQALSFCSFPERDGETDLSATSIETLRSMVALGAGVTLVPEMAIRRSDQILYVPFAGTKPVRNVGIIYRSTFYDTEMIEELASVLEAHARKEKFTIL